MMPCRTPPPGKWNVRVRKSMPREMTGQASTSNDTTSRISRASESSRAGTGGLEEPAPDVPMPALERELDGLRRVAAPALAATHQ